MKAAEAAEGGGECEKDFKGEGPRRFGVTDGFDLRDREMVFNAICHSRGRGRSSPIHMASRHLEGNRGDESAPGGRGTP